jgi:hypothetical protein
MVEQKAEEGSNICSRCWCNQRHVGRVRGGNPTFLEKPKDMLPMLLAGQTTDSSGGGGVSESLAKELKKRNPCTPTHLVASCTPHAVQIALAKPVKQTLGEGALGVRTTTQMLHSAYDLQELMKFSEFGIKMEESQQWVEHEINDCSPEETHNPKTKDFLNAWDKVNECVLPHNNGKELPQKIQTPQSVLTRWWCIGVCTAFLKSHHDIVLRATQIAININDSESCPNKIASGLQLLLKESVACSALLFLAQFHMNFLAQHFKWFQEEDEVAKKPSFRPWQILVQC